jgi:Ca2+-binding RTX toxin-like protein
VEAVAISRTSSLIYTTRGGNDVLSVVPGILDLLTVSATVSGTSGSVETVPVNWTQVREVDFNLGTWDRAGAANDSLTFAPRTLTTTGLSDLLVRTGAGDDTLAFNDANLRLPLGGRLEYLPGEGSDQLSVTANANLSLNSVRLASSAGGELFHNSLESAVLSGGAGDNVLSAEGFNGWVTLYGNDGNDQLRGSSNNDRIYGGNGDDQIFGGLGNDWLYGEAGVDSFYFDGTAGADNLAVTRLLSLGVFDRYASGSGQLLERDNFQFDDSDIVQVNAKEGDDSIAIDLAFAIYGIVDGGLGNDTCTAPARWTKISC